MLFRQRLRAKTGCITCKRRRKKCDEAKPVCAVCQRLRIDCCWTSDQIEGANKTAVCTFAVRIPAQESSVPKSLHLSAFQADLCTAYTMGTCFKVNNAPFDPNDNDSGWSMHATLTFAPYADSLALQCLRSHSLLYVGHRVHNSTLVQRGIMQRGTLVQKLRAALADNRTRYNYDTLAAISNLASLTVCDLYLPPASLTRQQFSRCRIEISDVNKEALAHSAGLIAIMEKMQPHSFQSAQALTFFEHVRFTQIMMAICFNQESILTSEAWKTVPWAQTKRRKNSLQTLVDLLCDICPLQSRLPLLAPYNQSLHVVADQRDREVIARLLVELYKWRHSFGLAFQYRMEVTDRTSEASLDPQARPSLMRFDRRFDLYELGIFNMLLIYLCRFMEARPSAICTMHISTLVGLRDALSQLDSDFTTTRLTLPIDNPSFRAKIAAREILMIWEYATSTDTVAGDAAFMVPLHVARSCLDQEADTVVADLNRALDQIATFWSAAGMT